MGEFTGKKAVPEKLGARFAQACANEMRMDMSEESFFARIYTKFAAPHSLGERIARACVVEMHMDMSHNGILTRKMLHPRS